MSKVKIEGNASGTGTLTISAPNTNTDRSLTLPDGAGEILLANGDGSSLTGIATGNLNGADCFRLSANFSGGNNTVINSNWERVDTGTFGKIGTGLTESSGVFTFPDTGYWFIHFFSTAQNSNSDRKNGLGLSTTSDNGSNWVTVSKYQGYTNVNSEPHAGSQSHIVDITNTSTHKIRLLVNTSDTSTLYYGDNSVSYTGFTVIKLGDT